MTSWRLAGYSGLVALGLLAAPALASAQGFTGYFAPGNWTLTNSPGGVGGSFVFNDPDLTVIGGNVSVAGFTFFTITAPDDGEVSFNWGYTSTDSDDWDQAGYVINGTPFFLAQNDSQVPFHDGLEIFNVNAGDEFGFYVETVDGAFGAGNFGVNNFTFTAAPIPEPTSLALLGFVAAGGAAGWLRRKNKLPRRRS
ncbi:MAG TPA: PEP-CTERM sorting domain-containing protein [Gemmatales bacterium]|nr:PEP-CTERM sorting domain-containing protein [Gemmatales bacterium]HMP59890.1 PEP-CTERM sorting domain-containing protein [Gemmatales bacterium]